MKNTDKSNNNIKLVPVGDRVLVEPNLEEKTEKTKTGIYLPTSGEKEQPQEGKVIAVGEGRYENGQRIPMTVKVGDKVVFSKYAYDEVTLEGKKYFMFKEENILAIIK